MNKQDFEKLIGKEITVDHWKTVNFCYVACIHLFHDEQSLVDYYNRNGLEGFYQLREDYINGKEISPGTKVVNEWVESLKDESRTCQSVDMDAKAHFESITSCTVTDNEYYRIEKCINAFSDLLATVDDIALFYHTFGINGIYHLLCDLAGFKAAEEHNLNHCREVYRAEHDRYLDLSIKYNQLSSYISAFLQALVEFFNKVLSDPLFSFDYSKSVFHALINYLNKEIERFESEVK